MFIKVARVLVEAHQYDEAIKYYNKSGLVKLVYLNEIQLLTHSLIFMFMIS